MALPRVYISTVQISDFEISDFFQSHDKPWGVTFPMALMAFTWAVSWECSLATLIWDLFRKKTTPQVYCVKVMRSITDSHLNGWFAMGLTGMHGGTCMSHLGCSFATVISVLFRKGHPMAVIHAKSRQAIGSHDKCHRLDGFAMAMWQWQWFHIFVPMQ